MTYSPRARAEEIAGRIHRAVNKPDASFSFVISNSSFGSWKNGYFPRVDLLSAELAGYAPAPFGWRNPDQIEGRADVVIVACAGAKGDLDVLVDLREKVGPYPVIALWLFDNHISEFTNLNLAHAADFVFFSHHYFSNYLFQHNSVNCLHVPACSAQWTTRQAAEFFAEREQETRNHKLLINYVAYANYSETRQRVLAEYERGLECADVFLMPGTDRSRYDSLSPKSRFDEWARYKATVIVPLDSDLSTRVFDALLTGMIPIVPRSIFDFDAVIPPDVQTALGIVRVASLELPEIQEAARRALATFDAMGGDGCRARHEYALSEHMVVNRVTTMLYMLWLFGTRQAAIEYANDHAGPALYWRRTDTAP